MIGDRSDVADATPFRLFIAVELPAAVGPILDEAFAAWRARFPRVRWVEAERRHVTLTFLGPTEPSRIDGIRHEIGEVAAAAAPIDVALGPMGAFPSLDRARVLWVGAQDGASRLASLATKLDARLAPFVPADDRPFVPHVTVGRSDRPLHLPRAYAATPLEGAAFTAAEVVLFRSHVGSSAVPRYEPIVRAPLRG